MVSELGTLGSFDWAVRWYVHGAWLCSRLPSELVLLSAVSTLTAPSQSTPWRSVSLMLWLREARLAVLEAGLGFAVRLNKPDFIGRCAVLRKQDSGLLRRMLQFQIKDAAPMVYHNEAIVRDGKIVGPVTSGAYGHFLGGAIGMGYVPCAGQSEAEVLASTYEIEIAGVRHAAIASLQPLYDPKSDRIRA